MKIVQFHNPGSPDLAPYKSMFDENNIEFVQYPEFLFEEEQLKYCEGADAIATSILKFPREVIEKLPEQAALPTLSYRITDGVLERWVYSPAGYEGAPIATDFTETL